MITLSEHEMDERIFAAKCGVPVPGWDLKHRLFISSYIGKVCMDSGTVFRFNSTFMDVSDQPHLSRHYVACGLIVSLFGALANILLCTVVMLGRSTPDDVRFLWAPLVSMMTLPLVFVIVRWFRSEFFALTRRPFRFHRVDRKIYAIRRRRSCPGSDEAWSIPWTEESIFCVHRGERNNVHTFHIRYYEVDAQGNVVRGCSLGREWEGEEALPLLFAQWNYWCLYMKEGAARLPLPSLFLSERETVLESFLTCLYWMGGTLTPAARIFLMPFVVTFTGVRILALRTCRDPVWPEEIAKRCEARPDDLYSFPNEGMPVGWGPTTLARQENRYPRDPKLILEEFIPVEVEAMTQAV